MEVRPRIDANDAHPERDRFRTAILLENRTHLARYTREPSVWKRRPREEQLEFECLVLDDLPERRNLRCDRLEGGAGASAHGRRGGEQDPAARSVEHFQDRAPHRHAHQACSIAEVARDAGSVDAGFHRLHGRRRDGDPRRGEPREGQAVQMVPGIGQAEESPGDGRIDPRRARIAEDALDPLAVRTL